MSFTKKVLSLFHINTTHLSRFLIAPFLIGILLAIVEGISVVSHITLSMLIGFVPFLLSGIIYLICTRNSRIGKYSLIITIFLYFVMQNLWFWIPISFLHSEAMYGSLDGLAGAIIGTAVFFGFILYILVSCIGLSIVHYLLIISH